MRTPLSGVIGAMCLLSDRDLTVEQQEIGMCVNVRVYVRVYVRAYVRACTHNITCSALGHTQEKFTCQNSSHMRAYKHARARTRTIRIRTAHTRMHAHYMCTGLYTCIAFFNMSRSFIVVNIAQVCSNQLLSVINDVLEISKLAEDKLELDPVPFSLHEALEESVQACAPSNLIHFVCMLSFVRVYV